MLILCGAPASFAQSQVIPQVADGGGWQTTFVFTNTAVTQASASLTFFQETSGGATQGWNLPLIEAVNPQSISLPAGGTLFLHTTGTASTTAVGWAQVQTAPTVAVYAIFTQRVSGRQDQDGTAPATAATSRVLVPFDNSSNFITSVALVNSTASSETISANFETAAGAISQGSPITLPAQGHTAFGLPQQFPATQGQSGLAEFYTSNGSLAAIALRFNPTGAFTAAPVYQQSGAPIIGNTSGAGTPQVQSVTLSAAQVTGGGSVQGTVTLSAAAPSGGAAVALSSSSSIAAVPASVVVPAGATSATFTVSVQSVTTSQAVTITATYGSASAQATITVMPGGGASISFSSLTATLTFSPTGYSSGQFPLTITPNAGNGTYTGTSGIGVSFTNGTISGNTLTFNSLQPGSVFQTAEFDWGSNIFLATGVSMTLTLQPTSTVGVILGSITGTVSVTGTFFPGGGSAITLTGPLSGNFTALP